MPSPDRFDSYKKQKSQPKLWKPPPLSLTDNSYISHRDYSTRTHEKVLHSRKSFTKYNTEPMDPRSVYPDELHQKRYEFAEYSYKYKRPINDYDYPYDKRNHHDERYPYSSERNTELHERSQSRVPYPYFRSREQYPFKLRDSYHYENRRNDQQPHNSNFRNELRDEGYGDKELFYEKPPKYEFKPTSKVDHSFRRSPSTNRHSQYLQKIHNTPSNEKVTHTTTYRSTSHTSGTDSFSDISSSSCSPPSKEIERRPDTISKKPSTSTSKNQPATIQKKLHKNLATLSRADLEKIIPHMNDIDAKYDKICQIGEGTYGKVYKGIVKGSGVGTPKYVAMKKVRMECEKEGFPITATREIKILTSMNHKNIIRLIEIVTSKESVYMVFDYMEYDLAALVNQASTRLELCHVKYLIKEVLNALAYLHENNIYHRDIKSSNILLSKDGAVKLADFGLARCFSVNPTIHMTNRVITLWYRPPELLLGSSSYDSSVDMWGVGCLLVEWLLKSAPFQGSTEISQLSSIFHVLGSDIFQSDWSDCPTLAKCPWSKWLHPPKAKHPRILESWLKEIGLSELGCNFATSLLEMEPSKRISAKDAIKHGFFEEEPIPCHPTDLPIVEGEWHEFEVKRHSKKTKMQDTDSSMSTSIMEI